MNDSIIPESWISFKLEELCHIIKSGGTPTSTNEAYYQGNIPFVIIEDVTKCGKYLGDTIKHVTPEAIYSCNTWLVPANSLLYTIYATLGEVCINKLPVTTNQAILNLIPNEKIYLDFFYYWLEWYKLFIHKKTSQTTQSNLNAEIVKNFILIIPESVEEQQKIVSILENVDNTIDKTQEIIEKYEMMKRGLMQDLISNNDFKNDRIVNIDEILLKIKRGPSLSANVDGRGVIYLTSDNINENNKLILNELKYLDNYYETEKCKIEYGDVIINCVNSEERVGKTAFFGIKLDNIIVGFNNFALKFDSTINSKYIYYYLSSDSFQKQIRQRIKPAINQVSFSGRDLTSLRIKIPELIKEQKNISDILTSIDIKIESEQKYLNKLQKIKAGLMQDLLTGKVRVKVEA